MIVKDLKPEDSIKLQAQGIGGKRRMGCGVFYPNVPSLRRQQGGSYEAEAVIS